MLCTIGGMKDVERVKVLVREIEGLSKDDPNARPSYRKSLHQTLQCDRARTDVALIIRRSLDKIDHSLLALVPERNFVEVSNLHSLGSVSASTPPSTTFGALFGSIDTGPHLGRRGSDSDQTDVQLPHQRESRSFAALESIRASATRLCPSSRSVATSHPRAFASTVACSSDVTSPPAATRGASASKAEEAAVSDRPNASFPATVRSRQLRQGQSGPEEYRGSERPIPQGSPREQRNMAGMEDPRRVQERRDGVGQG